MASILGTGTFILIVSFHTEPMALSIMILSRFFKIGLYKIKTIAK